MRLRETADDLGLLARRHIRGRPRQRTGNTSLVITAPWRAGVAVTTAACLGLSLLPFIAQLAVAAGSVANVDGARIAAATPIAIPLTG